MKAIITNSAGKKVKTITGSTNINGYFYKKFNEYCKSKGYNKMVEGKEYIGNLAWSNGTDILKMEWL